MRLLFSMSSFAVTMILGLLAFTFTAIYYPTTMRTMLSAANHFRDQISLLGLSDSYMVWIDIFLESKQIVLVGYSIAVRLGMLFVMYLVQGRPSPPSAPTSSNDVRSPFGKW